MTSWQSLLYCAAADVTLDRIENLLAVTGTESLTVEFKEGGGTATIPECAAAMANAQGGLIFVGITDETRDVVGVPKEALAHVADVFAAYLESPDWAPEMIEVPLGDDKPGRFVLVIRVNRDTAPRPVFIQGKRKVAAPGLQFGCPARPARQPAMSCIRCSPSQDQETCQKPIGTSTVQTFLVVRMADRIRPSTS